MDIKTARTQFDCRQEVEKALGRPKQRTAKSWAWDCPFHQDHKTPSFHVYQEGYHCYGCGEHGDIFDWFSFWTKQPLAEVLKGHCIDPYEEARRKAEYAEHVAKQLEHDIEKAQAALKELRESCAHLKYYEQAAGEGKRLWEKRGVPEWYQDWLYLGYDPSHRFWAGQDYTSPTLTIPIYETETREVLNIKHRILGNAADHLGKYRPERSGLPAALFAASPDLPIAGRILAVEGEIKSMVTYITLSDPSFQVVGLPSKNPNEIITKQLAACEQVVLCLDPDADPRPLAKEIGLNKTRLMFLPQKIDDYILTNGLDADWLKNQIRMARRA